MAREAFRWHLNTLPLPLPKSTEPDKSTAAEAAQPNGDISRLPTMPEREKNRAAEMLAEMPSQNFPTAKGKKDRRHRGRRWRAKGFPSVRKSATSARDTAGIISGWQACTKRRSSVCHGRCE